MFTPNDLDYMSSKGIVPDKVERQLDNFQKGFPYLPIDRPAVIGDGIKPLSPEYAMEFASKYDKRCAQGKVQSIKFVPASGAATRMFKDLYDFINTGQLNPATEQVVLGIRHLAFYEDLQELGIDFPDPHKIVDAVVNTGLVYGTQPKGLVKFHNYPEGGRTALEEHLVEGALYGMCGNNPVKIHFTVSPEHMEGFCSVVEHKAKQYQDKYGVRYEITYSVQESSTDTIAVDMNNQPLRYSDGNLAFRPAGHGALIENLNNLDADIIFIKTVDNVVPDHLKADTVLYKKALAGLVLDLQEKIFAHVNAIDSGDADPGDIISFIECEIGYRLPKSTSYEQLRSVLDRPLRVCGMVRNEGEPGGGPFWVNNDDGSKSLQIAESSQILPDQQYLIKQATHFNPVDLVCAVKDYRGRKFDLEQFVDLRTGFISKKSKDGVELKAQELPGLWNGAMANWNTVFIEVPISTFAPVKTISDLFRDQHT